MYLEYFIFVSVYNLHSMTHDFIGFYSVVEADCHHLIVNCEYVPTLRIDICRHIMGQIIDC